MDTRLKSCSNDHNHDSHWPISGKGKYDLTKHVYTKEEKQKKTLRMIIVTCCTKFGERIFTSNGLEKVANSILHMNRCAVSKVGKKFNPFY